MSEPLLEMKNHIQQELDAQAGHDLGAYLANLHQIVLATEREYGLTFHYESLQNTKEPDPVSRKTLPSIRKISKRTVRAVS